MQAYTKHFKLSHDADDWINVHVKTKGGSEKGYANLSIEKIGNSKNPWKILIDFEEVAAFPTKAAAIKALEFGLTIVTNIGHFK